MLKRILSANFFSTFFYLFLYLFVFSFAFALPIDPDLGWHLRYGEEVAVNKNILKVDTFSHTFKGLNVIDTEWLVEAIFYAIFSRFSFLGLAFVSAFFTSLAFFLPVIFINGNIFVKFLLTVWAVIGSSPLLGVGARVQNISLIFFSLLLVLLLKFTQSRRWQYIVFLPAVFFIWSKAHPGFFVGIFLLIAILSIELFFALVERNRKKFISAVFLLLIFIFSLIVLNIRSKNETAGRFSLSLFRTLALPASVASQTPLTGSVRKTISEWKPPLLVDFPGTLFLLAIIYAIAIFTKPSLDRADIKHLFLFFGFIYFSTLSRRNVPFFFLVFLPIAIPYTEELINKINIKIFLPYLTWLALLIMIFISLTKISQETKKILREGASIDAYCQAMKYPCRAVEFIKKTKPVGNMFNHYNWGGYLIWQLPQYPVFIDGRVPGGEVFTEFEKVNALKPEWEEILEKYKVTWMLMPSNSLFDQLVTIDGKWERKYTDNVATIFSKSDQK